MVLCAGHTTRREQGSYSESVQCHTEADARGMGSGAGVPHLFLPETPSGKCHYSEFLENGNPHLSNLSRGSSKEMVRLEVEGDDPRMSPNANSSHHTKWLNFQVKCHECWRRRESAGAAPPVGCRLARRL